MSADPVSVEYIDAYRLHVRFEDGIKGVADFAELVREGRGRLKALRDREYFKQARVDREAGTVVWPNGVDVCPDVLYWLATGTPIKWASDPRYRKPPPHWKKAVKKNRVARPRQAASMK